MDSAERFENHEPSVFNELIQAGYEEEVIEQYRLAFVKFLAGAVEIEIDVKVF